MLTKLKSLLSLTGPQVDYLRPLKTNDIPKVLTIERQMYSYPWSEGIFKDCLKIGYSNWAFIKDGQFVGYVILSVAVGEAHILNICLDPAYQGKGLGRQFLKEVLIIAKKKKCKQCFLRSKTLQYSSRSTL